MTLSPSKKVIARLVMPLLFALAPLSAVGGDTQLGPRCDDFNWSDVEQLVQPYLSDDLYTALVMQGQSAEYRTSAAASQAMNEALPEPIKRILQALIDKDC